MITIASSGTTPPAFVPVNKKTADGAAKTAAGFGAASMQQIQQIELQMQSQLKALLADAATQAHAGEANTNKADAGKPELRQADMPRLTRAAQARAESAPGQRPLTPEAVLTLLTLELAGVLNDENTRSLAAQLEVLKARLAARSATAAELQAAIELAQKLVDSAFGDVGAAEGELAAAMEALKQAQAEVARLEQALADAPESEKEAIRAQLEAAKAHAGVQQGRVDAASVALNTAMVALEAALADLETLEQAVDDLDPVRSSTTENVRALTNQAALSELLARLMDLMAKANDLKMAKEIEFTKNVLKAREEENTRRAEEYEREMEKAEQAQKKMGCIGKIVGWVITAVAVVAAPFTGGVSMALAGVGLALAIGEEFGLDIMGKVMEPIMKVVMGAVKAIGNMLGDLLVAIGVPEDIANKMKDVLAVVAVAALVIAIAFLSKKAASNVAVQTVTKAVTKAVTEAISKALPAIVKSFAHGVKSTADDVAKAITNATAKVIKQDADTLAVRAAQTTKAMHVMQFTNQAAQGVGASVVAGMQVKASEINAALELGMADSEILRELIQRILNYFLQSNEQLSALFKDLSDQLSTQDQSAHYITARVGRTA